MEYKLYIDYKETDWLRNSFYDFAEEIFGLSFRKWYEHGFWNDSFICYSLVDGDRVISNISLTKMTTIIDGEEKKAVQLGTVGTIKEYRGKGLSRYLMEKVLEDYRGSTDFFFLSANNSVVDFYPRFGFRRLNEFEFWTELSGYSNMYYNILSSLEDKYYKQTDKLETKMRRLEITNQRDLNIIKDLFKERIPISNRFAAENYLSIFLWYIVNFYQDCVWYSEDRDMIIVYKISGNTIHIFDILSREKIVMKEVLECIITTAGFKEAELKELERIRYHFTPDLVDIPVNSKAITDEDPFFVQGEFSLIDKAFKVPQLSQT